MTTPIAEDPAALIAEGVAALRRGQARDAESLFLQALRLDPHNPKALSNLGGVLRQRGAYRKAESAYRLACRLAPSAVRLYNLAAAVRDQGRLREAEIILGESLEIDPEYLPARALLGHWRIENWERGAPVENLDSAIGEFTRALELDPGCPDRIATLAMAHQEAGHWPEAIQLWDHCCALVPDSPEPYHRRGQCRLAQGDFAGWTDWSRQHDRPEIARCRRMVTDRPLWDGCHAPEATLLLYNNHGAGDAIQFVRYAARARERVGRLIVACDPALTRLLRLVEGVDAVVDYNRPIPPHDTQCSLMALPGVLGATLDDIPPAPYLRAPERLAEAWRERLEPILAGAAVRAGVCWRGDPRHRLDRRRSFPPGMLARLADVPGVSLVSLQQGHSDALDPRVHTLGPEYAAGDWLDTAAVLDRLDLVIACDTGIAHLAGTLGCPIWIALAQPPDWRWFLDRDDSPWYPAVRLFRQRRPGDWEGVFDRMAAVLRSVVRSLVIGYL